MTDVLDIVGVVARVAAGATLMFAGIAKLRSKRWPVLALEMGTPRPVVVGLPAFESMLGLALVLQVGKPVPAILSVGLFLAFTAVVAVQYFSGSEKGCNCFGGNEEAVISAMTLARNVLLVFVAVLGTF